jgi:hypothetical protein
MANGKVSQKDILNLINKKAGRQIAFTAEEENQQIFEIGFQLDQGGLTQSSVKVN